MNKLAYELGKKFAEKEVQRTDVGDILQGLIDRGREKMRDITFQGPGSADLYKSVLKGAIPGALLGGGAGYLGAKEMIGEGPWYAPEQVKYAPPMAAALGALIGGGVGSVPGLINHFTSYPHPEDIRKKLIE